MSGAIAWLRATTWEQWLALAVLLMWLAPLFGLGYYTGKIRNFYD